MAPTTWHTQGASWQTPPTPLHRLQNTRPLLPPRGVLKMPTVQLRTRGLEAGQAFWAGAVKPKLIREGSYQQKAEAVIVKLLGQDFFELWISDAPCYRTELNHLCFQWDWNNRNRPSSGSAQTLTENARGETIHLSINKPLVKSHCLNTLCTQDARGRNPLIPSFDPVSQAHSGS